MARRDETFLIASSYYGRPPAWKAALRGLTRRCPRCGSGKLFRRWFLMVDDCPRCGLHFERSQGYWLGAITINMAATIAAFLVTFVGGMALTWPDVPWDALLVAVIAVAVVIPILIHPIARTTWVALERQFRSRSEPYD